MATASHLSSAKRRQVAAATLLCAMALLTGCLRSTQTQVLTELNADRAAYKLRTLGTQADAQNKAQAWAEKLARENILYHSTLSSHPAKWCSTENVTWPCVVGRRCHMASPGHKANIVSTAERRRCRLRD